MSRLRPAALVTVLAFSLLNALPVVGAAGDPQKQDKSQSDAAPGKPHKIKFVRPAKAGDRYAYTADGAMLQKARSTVDGRALGQSEGGFGVHLEGTVEVLAVGDTGEEAKVACKVAKCVRQTAEGDGELIPAGRVVTAVAGKDKTTFTLDEGALSDEARDALDLVLRLADDDGFTDDDLYGTDEPRRVGDTWPVRAEAVAKSAAVDKVEIKKEDVSGTLKLEGIETVEGVECQKIAGSLRVTRVIPTKTDDLPKGVKVTDGSMDARFSGLFPTDLSKGSLSESMSMVMTHTLEREAGGEGPAMTIETTTRRAVEVKRKFLEPGERKDAKADEGELKKKDE